MAETSWLGQLLQRATGTAPPDGAQLLLPGPRELLRPWSVDLGLDGDGLLEIQLTPRGMTLRLELPRTADEPPPADRDWADDDEEPPFAAWPRDDERGWAVVPLPVPEPDEPVLPAPARLIWSATVKVTPRARARLPRLGGGDFLLVPGLGRRFEATTEGTLAVLRLIADAQWEASGALDPSALTDAARLLGAAAAHLPALCGAAALRASQGYPGRGLLHWFVYESVVNDATGRVGQISEVCPGLLILARGLRGAGDDAGCLELLRAVEQGLKLGRVLDLAAELWSARVAAQGCEPPTARERTVQRQRIRRAGKLAAPAALLATFAPGAAVDDIPREPAANARWLAVTGHRLLRRNGGARLSGRQLHGLGSFVSRHLPVLQARAQRTGVGWDRVLGELIDYIRATGRVPGRGSDPRRLLAECRDWHGQGHWERHAGLPAETPLDTAGLTAWSGRGCTITPLTTVGQLVRESREMRHCVAMHARRAAAGEVQIVHAELRGRPLTVMTRREGGRLCIVEASGPGNRGLTAGERELLARWLAAVEPG